MASNRVDMSFRKIPWTAEVTVMAPGLATPPHRHAEVLGLDYHHGALGFEGPLDGVGDL